MNVCIELTFKHLRHSVKLAWYKFSRIILGSCVMENAVAKYFNQFIYS